MTNDEMLESILGEERYAQHVGENSRFWEEVMVELNLTETA